MTTSDNHHDPAVAGAPRPGAGTADDPQPRGPEGDAAAGNGGAADEPLIAPREPEAAEGPDLEALTPEELEALAARAAKADEYLSLAQRKQAEFENYRKRAARDATVAQERGAVKLAMALLPAIDNLERALAHAPADPDEHGFVAGVKHVHSDVVSALHKAGIEQFSPDGEAFDPTQHEAVAQQPIEGAQPGTVVEVYQRGYRVGETIVRPARVVVAA